MTLRRDRDQDRHQDQDQDQDPGWWRRGMSKRARWIVVLGAVALLAFVAIIIVVNGIPLF